MCVTFRDTVLVRRLSSNDGVGAPGTISWLLRGSIMVSCVSVAGSMVSLAYCDTAYCDAALLMICSRSRP